MKNRFEQRDAVADALTSDQGLFERHGHIGAELAVMASLCAAHHNKKDYEYDIQRALNLLG